MNLFTAQAESWNAITALSRALTNPPTSVEDDLSFRTDLAYVATHSAGWRSVIGGTVVHEVTDHGFDGKWQGFAEGFEEMWWESATSGARIGVFLREHDWYQMRFVGTQEDRESSYLFEFLKAADLDTLEVEQLAPQKIRKALAADALPEEDRGRAHELLRHVVQQSLETEEVKS